MTTTIGKLKIGKFSDGAADLFLDDAKIGWIEQLKSGSFASASSRRLVERVSGYSVMLWEVPATKGVDATLIKDFYASRAECLEIVRTLLILAQTPKGS